MPDQTSTAAIHVVLTTGEVTATQADRMTFHEDTISFWADGVEVSRFQEDSIDHVLLPTATAVEAGRKFSVAAVRETHRNAYGKWTDDEDALLLKGEFRRSLQRRVFLVQTVAVPWLEQG